MNLKKKYSPVQKALLSRKGAPKKKPGLRPGFNGKMLLMGELHWEDSEDLALALMEAHPDVDPLTIRFTDLRAWVTELPGFADDPAKSNEGKLEAIQMAWHEEYTDR